LFWFELTVVLLAPLKANIPRVCQIYGTLGTLSLFASPLA
jgi:hypothetical protein